MTEFLTTLLLLITQDIVPGLNVFELTWVVLGLLAFVRHQRSLGLANKDWADIAVAEKLKKIDKIDAGERRVVVRDRRITERIRSTKQAVFIVVGLYLATIPANPDVLIRVGSLLLGSGLIVIQVLLYYNSIVNANTRTELDRLATEREKERKRLAVNVVKRKEEAQELALSHEETAIPDTGLPAPTVVPTPVVIQQGDAGPVPVALSEPNHDL